MKTTLALQWKALVDNLHPPLPMTTRDSQRLLNLLTSSFRQRLDQSHPIKEHNYANDHVQSILTSPLFLSKPATFPKPLQYKTQHTASSPSWIRRMRQEPMAVLQAQIGAGAANLDLARVCLESQMSKCSAEPDVKASMKLSNAGSIVLHWLWSSGLERSLKFLIDRQVTKLLISFLVAEGRRDPIHSWIRQENQLLGAPLSDDPKKTQSRIIFQLIKAETLYGAGPAFAIKTFVQKMEEFLKAKKKPKGIRSRFSPAGLYITMALPLMLKLGEISVDDYNDVLKSTEIWCKPNAFEMAWLAINHPRQPSADCTLAYLHQLGPKDVAGLPQGRRSNTVAIALKAAELFLEHDQRYSVEWIMEALKTHFAPEIGHEASMDQMTSTLQTTRGFGERSNVQLLEGLALECGGSLAVDLLARSRHASDMIGG